MQILMTGGTGFVGKALIKQLLPSRITILTRDIELAKKQLHHFNSNYFELIDSLDELDNLDKFDAVINLAGEPIVERRWSATQKQRICSSRWQVTEKLVELICCSDTPPAVFISGSAVGIYGDQGNTVVNEQTECPTSNFPFHVCSQWEAIALKAQSEQTRVCLLRTGVVLGLDGGALKKCSFHIKWDLAGLSETANNICLGYTSKIWCVASSLYWKTPERMGLLTSLPLIRSPILNLASS